LREISKPEEANVVWRMRQVSNAPMNHAHSIHARIKSEVP
jgi:hypothetical protein